MDNVVNAMKTVDQTSIFYLALLLILPLSFLSDQISAAQNNSLAPILVGNFSANSLEGWQEKVFANKTSYQLVKQEENIVLQAKSNASASGLFKEVNIDLTTHPFLNWKWKVEKGHPPLAERTKEGDDYAARIYVVTKGGLLFWKTKAVEYIWSSSEKKGATWPNAFAKKHDIILTVRSPEDKKQVWYQEKRNVYEDFKKSYGEEIKNIQVIAIMTDSDNSRGSAQASYGDISFTTN